MELRSESPKPQENKLAFTNKTDMPELKRIKELISDEQGKIRRCSFFTLKNNEKLKEQFERKLEGLGVNKSRSVAALLPTDSMSYAQIMLPLFRARIYADQDLINFDLLRRPLRGVSFGGTKFEIIKSLKNYLIAVDKAKVQSLANSKM
jgi:hypothetical protein